MRRDSGIDSLGHGFESVFVFNASILFHSLIRNKDAEARQKNCQFGLYSILLFSSLFGPTSEIKKVIYYFNELKPSQSETNKSKESFIFLKAGRKYLVSCFPQQSRSDMCNRNVSCVVSSAIIELGLWSEGRRLRLQEVELGMTGNRTPVTAPRAL